MKREGSELPSSLSADPEVSAALAKTFGVNEEEWNRIIDTLGRLPTFAELGVVSVMWSEHCSYKSSRVHLRRLPTTGPKVVQGPGENAGAVDIGDGWCAVFKMESHNHPSYIEPYQGAATGVGGILRDVFTMGARPIASLNSLRFGRPDHPKTARLLRGVVAGIGGYGNSIGVPTVGGEVQFDASYDGNILVNAFTVGIAQSEELFFGRADGVGNAIIYVGARTGRDGIHGATMASAEFDEHSEKKLPTVQVGDPFMEKLLLEACLEIFAADVLEGVQDMGAAGLTSSSVEMAARAGNGIELDLDAIPRRTKKLTPYEMLLSESQERMLMVAKPGREDAVLAICKKWDLDVAIVGHVTDTGRFVCKATPDFDPLTDDASRKRPVTVVDLPIGMLTDDAPKYDRPQRAPTPTARPTLEPSFFSSAGGEETRSGGETKSNEQATTESLGSEVLKLVGSPNVGSRQWVIRQYDHIVRDGTVVRPGRGDAAVVRVFCGDQVKYLALAADCNGRFVQLDAQRGAAMAVAECARNVVCAGGEPLGLTDCLNFGSPEAPETMWRFAQAVDGIRDACNALGVPVVSGNVSLYNETDGKPILPTPTVAIVGQLHDVADRLQMGFAKEGDVIAHVGAPSRGHLDGSEWLVARTGKVEGECPPLDLAAEVALQKAVLALARAHVLASAHDVSDGGLAACLAESCIVGGVGATVTLPGEASIPAFARLFAEEPSRIVISFSPSHQTSVETLLTNAGTPYAILGRVGGTTLSIADAVTLRVSELAEAHRTCLAGIVGDD